MMVIGLCRILWIEVFYESCYFAKLLLFPIFFGITLALLPVALTVFVFVELPVFIIYCLITINEPLEEKLDFFKILLLY